MKVALIYDRVNKWGGAERVLLSLHELFPSAPLYTSVYNPVTAKWAKVFPEVIPSYLQKIPFAKDRHEFFPYLMPMAFESFDFNNFDLVISVTSEFGKSVITGPGTKHVCYCLTPTRYLWSGYDTYFNNNILRFLASPLISYLRYIDKIAAQRPDKIIAISSEVKRRVKKYYGRESQVVFPPVNIIKNTNKSKRKYYLIVSRLVSYKKIDLAVNVFNKLGLPLVIVGVGKEEKRLKQVAKSNIKFVGFVTEAELRGYYQKAKALIMPQTEDFGLVAVEAQMYGVPVVAYREGGVTDTVIDKVTGLLFREQTEKSLMEVVKRFQKIKFKENNLNRNVQRFSQKRFNRDFLRIISSIS